MRPSNCGLVGEFSDFSRASRASLKGIKLHFEGEAVRGEAVITKTGLEGGAIYALSAPLRDAIERDGEAMLTADLRPSLPAAELERALAKPRGKQSFSNVLRKAVKLSPAATGLLQEAAHRAGAPLASTAPAAIAALIKAVPHPPRGAGRPRAGDLDRRRHRARRARRCLMLRHLPGVFAAGEMLDWEAPTGGYLLQAWFATGAAAARGAIEWLEQVQANSAGPSSQGHFSQRGNP